MIDLYYWPTPNGLKLKLFFEETGLEHREFLVNLGKREQFAPEFLRISPNNKIPAMIDQDPPGGGEPIAIFESGAMLFYLANKSGQLIPTDMRARMLVVEWLFWQVAGLGPMAGQAGHFRTQATEKVPYAIDRFTNETHRLYGVLNGHLKDREYIGGEYSIADIAAYPWIVPHEKQGQNFAEFPHLQRWYDAIAARPAVQRTYANKK